MKMDRVIAGLIALAIGIWAVVSWWWFVTDVLKGLVALCLVGAGVILVGLGVKDGSGTLEEAEEAAEAE